MSVRVRFAPSPTGQVHIGNIRAAIFNWLFARHAGGQFLLRIEDTDRERSTPEAVQAVLGAMEWLGLTFDDVPLYQSTQREAHLAAAARLLEQGDAYRFAKGGEGAEATVFRLPWDAERVPGVVVTGTCEISVHPDEPVIIGREGVRYAQISSKGKPVAEHKCLAGFRDLEVLDAGESVRFRLADKIDEILAGRHTESVAGAARLRFTRRSITYQDQVKGVLAKPLDGLADFVIVRSDGHPVFHLGNVADDVTQGVTHIIRGDDHVENTYRHLFLFHALGATAPQYAHLPMIVNAQGKPYSKRDGAAYVGDFREKGYLPEALFNYLALCGWSPGDDREVMTRAELAAAFTLEKVLSSPAQVDLTKLAWMNGEHLRRRPVSERLAGCRADLVAHGFWQEGMDEGYLLKVIDAMAERIKLYTDMAAQAGFFFTEDYPYDEKVMQKRLRKPGGREGLLALREAWAALPVFTAAALEEALKAAAAAHNLNPSDLIHAARVAVSGMGVGPGLYVMLEVLGAERVRRRLERTLALVPAA
ncbi:MAG: glutamate--tRNA ligase [Lentisphaerae bacterium]|nr:glutamate--tRNA ligase [Lentisphaerota bacterium]